MLRSASGKAFGRDAFRYQSLQPPPTGAGGSRSITPRQHSDDLQNR